MDFLFGFKSVHVFSGEITLLRWEEWKGEMEEGREGGRDRGKNGGNILLFRTFND